MAYSVPSREHQQFIFDYIRADIDRDLREAGIDEHVAAHGFTIPEAGNEVAFSNSFSKLVVSRHFGYATVLADIDHDLDPTASTWTIEHEVGVRNEERDGTRVLAANYTALLVSTSMFDGPHEASGIGINMSVEQLGVVTRSITRLTEARRKGFLPFLTKSLLKIDPAGD